jgi:thioredoxin
MTELTDANFAEEVQRSELPVLVDFYAPWCGPCKMLGPILERLAAEFEGRIRFAKLNVDEAPELANAFEVTGVPTLMLFRGGQATEAQVGLASPKALKAWLEAAAVSSPASSLPNRS